MSRKMAFRDQDRFNRIIEGALKTVEAAAVTYGPHGGTVLLERASGYISTRDGATVIRELEFPDPLENIGAKIIKQASLATDLHCGDGTTTSAILAGAILREIRPHLIAEKNPHLLMKGVRLAVDEAREILRESVKNLRSHSQVLNHARHVCHGDASSAELITKALFESGKHGHVSVENARGVDDYIEKKKGTFLHTKPNPDYLNKVYDQPLVALFNRGLSTVDDVQHVIETASQWPMPLILVAPYIEGDAKLVIKMNKDQVTVVPVEYAFHKHNEEILKDLSHLLGGEVFDENSGMKLSEYQAEWFGKAQSVTIKNESVLFLGYQDDTVEKRLQARKNTLQVQLKHNQSVYDQDLIRKRIGNLFGGVTIIRMGGHTEVEMKERRARIEDALYSLSAILKSGAVPGAGMAYWIASEWLILQDQGYDDVGVGATCFARALQAPAKTLARNAGVDFYTLTERVKEARSYQHEDVLWTGYDFESGKARMLFTEPYITDAFSIVCRVMENAASAASGIITSQAAVY